MIDKDTFVPLVAQMPRSSHLHQFISHEQARSEAGHGEGAPPPVLPAESTDLSAKIRAILWSLPQANTSSPALDAALGDIQQAIRNSPTQLALPEFRLKETTAPTGAPAPAAAPQIALDKEGEKVSRIRVTCACGETIVLDCAY